MVTLSKYGAKYNRNILFLEGLSTDTKPTDEFDGLSIQNGSEYTEVDTGKKFLFDYDNATWYEVQTGGGGGTSNYNDLSNRPSVNNTVLTGNKTSAQLGLASSEQGGKADSAIQGVKLNSGSAITPDANNIVNITVGKADVGLGNVDNTSDANKPISTATQTALNLKADKTEIPSVPITAIQKNGTGITPVSGTVNITVPTTAADVSALPASTKYAAALSLTINSSTFVMTGQLKDQNGDNLGRAQTIDLPLESVVVGGSYNSQTKKVVLTLQNGNTIEFSVADLVSGLQTELSASNKLNPAFINYDSTHAAVTEAQREQIEMNKNNILLITPELIELVDNGAKNLVDIENSSGTRWLDKSLSLSSGTYRLYFGSLTSDAIGNTCQVLFMNGSTILDESYCYPTRGNNTSAQFTLNSDCTSIRIYAGGSYSESTDKTISFTNIMICSKSAWDVSQNYVPYAPTNAELYEMIKAL